MVRALALPLWGVACTVPPPFWGYSFFRCKMSGFGNIFELAISFGSHILYYNDSHA